MEFNMKSEGEKYKLFRTKEDHAVFHQMTKIISAGMTAMNTLDLAKRRLEVKVASGDDLVVRNNWYDTPLTSSDAVSKFPNGDVGIFYDSKQLGDVSNGSEDIIVRLKPSVIFTANDLNRMIFERSLSIREAKAHKWLLAIFHNDRSLLSSYVDLMSEVSCANGGQSNLTAYLPRNSMNLLKPVNLGRIKKGVPSYVSADISIFSSYLIGKKITG